jgi:hypothetical protein
MEATLSQSPTTKVRILKVVWDSMVSRLAPAQKQNYKGNILKNLVSEKILLLPPTTTTLFDLEPNHLTEENTYRINLSDKTTNTLLCCWKPNPEVPKPVPKVLGPSCVLHYLGTGRILLKSHLLPLPPQDQQPPSDFPSPLPPLSSNLPTPDLVGQHIRCRHCTGLREENTRFKTILSKKEKEIEQLKDELAAVDCGVYRLLEVIKTAELRAANSEGECESLWSEVEALKKDICELEVHIISLQKNDLDFKVQQQRLKKMLEVMSDKRTQFEDAAALAEYLEDFVAGGEYEVKTNKKKINELKKRSRIQRERLSEYESLVLLYGDSLEDITLARLMKNTVAYRKKVEKTEVGKAIIEEVKMNLVNLLKLSPDDTWDLQIKAGLTDEQLDKVRLVLGEKRQGFERLLSCSKSSGIVRRKEQSALFSKLKRKKSISGGTYFSLAASMRLLIELYGGGEAGGYVGNAKTFKWKVSIDGRKIAGKSQVMCGITPMDFGLAVQSCYNTFPVAIVCGKEDVEFLREEWKELFAEIAELNSSGVLIFSYPGTDVDARADTDMNEEGDGKAQVASSWQLKSVALKEQFLIPFFITLQIKNCSLIGWTEGNQKSQLDHPCTSETCPEKEASDSTFPKESQDSERGQEESC